MRHRRTLFASLLLVLASAVAAVVVVVARGDDSPLTEAAFLARVHAVCTEYGARLDEVQPPVDLSSPGAVYESIGAALPLLHEQLRAVRELDAPETLEADLDRFYALTDRSLVELEEAYEMAGARELFPMATALSRFEEVRDEAKAFARRLGFDC